MKKLNKKNGKKGFTLVELIVVIAIVAILAAIAIPSFNGIVKSSRQKAADADAKTIATEVAMYLAKYEAGEFTGSAVTSGTTTINAISIGNSLAQQAYDKSGVKLGPSDKVLVTIGGSETSGFTLTKVELQRPNSITGTFPKS